jgi:hypothetical protein
MKSLTWSPMARLLSSQAVRSWIFSPKRLSLHVIPAREKEGKKSKWLNAREKEGKRNPNGLFLHTKAL